MDWHDVFSSAVSRVAYDAEAKELHVEWQNGKRSVYDGVGPDVGADLHTRPSIGRALRAIKDNYGHRYV